MNMNKDRVKGMLWGLIVGDAFGSPIQFSDKDAHPWITEMVACPVFHLPPGYWTDDGSMAMCVMDSYVRNGGYDLKDIGDTFVRWYRDGYLSSMDGQSFDVGGATAMAMHEIVRGEPRQWVGRLAGQWIDHAFCAKLSDRQSLEPVGDHA